MLKDFKTYQFLHQFQSDHLRLFFLPLLVSIFHSSLVYFLFIRRLFCSEDTIKYHSAPFFLTSLINCHAHFRAFFPSFLISHSSEYPLDFRLISCISCVFVIIFVIIIIVVVVIVVVIVLIC